MYPPIADDDFKQREPEVDDLPIQLKKANKINDDSTHSIHVEQLLLIHYPEACPTSTIKN